jgi:hypothetical protein
MPVLSSARHSTFQDRCQLPNGLLFFRREVFLTRLGVDHQQVERRSTFRKDANGAHTQNGARFRHFNNRRNIP